MEPDQTDDPSITTNDIIQTQNSFKTDSTLKKQQANDQKINNSIYNDALSLITTGNKSNDCKKSFVSNISL